MISTTYTWDEFLNRGKTTEDRKVSASVSDGTSTVVSEGDTSSFSESNDTMGKDDFLNLLVTQLRYQDPLEPKADTEFVSQLAQFTQLENSQSMEESMTTLADSMNSFMDTQTKLSAYASNTSATALLGKDITVIRSGIEYTKGEQVTLDLELSSSGDHYVELLDSDDNVVATLPVSVDEAGKASITWGGILDTGAASATADYSIQVVKANTGNVSGYAFVKDTVNGLAYGSSGVILKTDSGDFSMSNLVSVEN